MSGRKLGLLQVQVTVPSYFVCPISLELMRDPVTLSSGQTFDRSSIQTWLDEGHNTCPVTRSPIDCLEEPIPNHALRRFIQSWCLQHTSFGIDPVLTPRQPPSLKDIPLLLDSLSSPSSFDALQQLSRLALDRPLSRRTILLSGAIPLLSKLLSRSFPGLAPLSSSLPSAPLGAADEVLKLLDLLISSDHQSISDHHKQLSNEDQLVVSLANSLLRTSKTDSRLKAASILLKLQPSDSLKRKMGQMQGFMTSLVAMIREDAPSSKAALGLLVEVCSVSHQNRVSATEAGAMGALADLLVSGQGLSSHERAATTETTLKALELLCQCAEGRATAASDTSILVAVVKQMTAVSERAAHYSVHIVLLVTKWAPEASKVKSLLVKEAALLKAIAVAQSAAASDTRLAAFKLAASLTDALPPSQLSHTMRLM